MKLLAHAKVNLSLEVGPRRADGYHPYESIATSVLLADAVDVQSVRRGGGEPRVQVITSTGIEDTLASRAAAGVLGLVLADSATRDELGIRIVIDKTVPPGAGLGGGSADAAAAMLGAAAIAGLARLDAVETDPRLLSLAVELGTDVPFCLHGGCARLHGRGELVDPRSPLPPIGMLVAVPPLAVSTREVFAAFDELDVGLDSGVNSGFDSGLDWGGRSTGEFGDRADSAWLRELVPGCSFRNDLEPAAMACEPQLQRWKARIEDVTGRPALMTGSGAGFVVFARHSVELADDASRLRLHGCHAWVTEPARSGVELVEA